jgi:intermediate peptidase
LKTFARHYSTGEIIPEKLVESMQGARKMFAATELQRQVHICLKAKMNQQMMHLIYFIFEKMKHGLIFDCLFPFCQIFYALIDHSLFGEQQVPPRDTSSIVADLKRQHTSWKHVEGTHWHTRFNHLLNYGAGTSEISQTSSIALKIENLNIYDSH